MSSSRVSLVSRSQTLSSIAQYHGGKGLGAFPGDDVAFPLGLGEVINVTDALIFSAKVGRVCAQDDFIGRE